MDRVEDKRRHPIQVDHDIFDHGLTAYELAVYVALIWHVNHQTYDCFPSRKRLAVMIKASVDTVDRALKKLQELKLIHISPRTHPDHPTRHLSNLYTLLDKEDRVAAHSGQGSRPQRPGVAAHSGSELLQVLTESIEQKNAAAVIKSYEANIALITQGVSDKINEALTIYPAQWIIDAFVEAALQNKRSWAYASAILKRWEHDGKNDDPPQETTENLYPSTTEF